MPLSLWACFQCDSFKFHIGSLISIHTHIAHTTNQVHSQIGLVKPGKYNLISFPKCNRRERGTNSDPDANVWCMFFGCVEHACRLCLRLSMCANPFSLRLNRDIFKDTFCSMAVHSNGVTVATGQFAGKHGSTNQVWWYQMHNVKCKVHVQVNVWGELTLVSTQGHVFNISHSTKFQRQYFDIRVISHSG